MFCIYSNSRFLLKISPTLLSRHSIYRSYTTTLDHFDHLLQNCTNLKQIKQIHSQIIHHLDALSTIFLPTRLISIYSKFHNVCDAQKVFQSLPNTCLSHTIIWNSILRANVTNGACRETVQDYVRMRKIGVFVDGFSFPLVIRACAMMGCLKLCALVHCHVLVMGFGGDVYVANELLASYGNLGSMGVARKVFDEMCVRNHVSWNTMVSGFASSYDCEGAIEMVKRMERERWEPNDVTWTSLLSSHARCGQCLETLRLYNVMRGRGVSASGELLSVVASVCNDSNVFDKGREVHGYVITAGFDNYSFAKNSLLCMYGKHGVFEAAEKLFSEIKMKSLVTWNGLISSYAQVGLCDEAYSAFFKLEKLGNGLKPNVISWSAVISGFASSGRSNESLNLFRKMLPSKVCPNVVTISSLLSATADLSTVIFGKEIHGYIIRNLMDDYLLVSNGLINMYAKCGNLKEGHIVFTKIKVKEICTWNTMIKGYGMHGHGESSLKIFEQMISNGYKPDGVTFVSLLSACSHTGLVTEGRKLFNQMKTEFRIEPEMEHYACMVDLLGRAGLFHEASEVARQMPIEPNVCVWGALLNSSRMHKNADWDEGSVSKILGTSSATGNYMLLSNIYAQSGQWEDSAKVRVSARVRGLTKAPGQSWIELNKRVHMFTAGNLIQREMIEVQTLLKTLSFQMKMNGYGLCSPS
uniref:putative pentatricopeptide repeat-containing protein At1g17630 n=1 Tax=Erigeron canadensis TaxID=72917 RepID=UPI001CB910EF|nr:putative pentatricopeptide repeat-containing protein At1g17630 [Erigeron canadensis]